MSHEQMKGVFKPLNEMLFLTEKDWENELPIEQYYAMILSYNDQIKGNKRERNKIGLVGKVYPLTLDEKIILEQAYKSGKSAAFDEQDIFKSLIAICDKSVADVLASSHSRKETLQQLHTLALGKILSNAYAKQNPFAVYQKASNFYDYVSDLSATEGFQTNKNMLEKLNTSDCEPDKQERAEMARGVAFEGIFSYIYDVIKVPVYADAYQKIINEAEAS